MWYWFKSCRNLISAGTWNIHQGSTGAQQVGQPHLLLEPAVVRTLPVDLTTRRAHIEGLYMRQALEGQATTLDTCAVAEAA